MADRIGLALPATSANAGRTDRAIGTAYQPSIDRPTFVSARFTHTVALGQSTLAVISVSADGVTWVEQERDALNMTGSLALTIAGIAASAITSNLVFKETASRHLRTWVPPGGYYRADATTANGATLTLDSVLERIF